MRGMASGAASVCKREMDIGKTHLITGPAMTGKADLVLGVGQKLLLFRFMGRMALLALLFRYRPMVLIFKNITFFMAGKTQFRGLGSEQFGISRCMRTMTLITLSIFGWFVDTYNGSPSLSLCRGAKAAKFVAIKA